MDDYEGSFLEPWSGARPCRHGCAIEGRDIRFVCRYLADLNHTETYCTCHFAHKLFVGPECTTMSWFTYVAATCHALAIVLSLISSYKCLQRLWYRVRNAQTLEPLTLVYVALLMSNLSIALWGGAEFAIDVTFTPNQVLSVAYQMLDNIPFIPMILLLGLWISVLSSRRYRNKVEATFGKVVRVGSVVVQCSLFGISIYSLEQGGYPLFLRIRIAMMAIPLIQVLALRYFYYRLPPMTRESNDPRVQGIFAALNVVTMRLGATFVLYATCTAVWLVIVDGDPWYRSDSNGPHIGFGFVTIGFNYSYWFMNEAVLHMALRMDVGDSKKLCGCFYVDGSSNNNSSSSSSDQSRKQENQSEKRKSSELNNENQIKNKQNQFRGKNFKTADAINPEQSKDWWEHSSHLEDNIATVA